MRSNATSIGGSTSTTLVYDHPELANLQNVKGPQVGLLENNHYYQCFSSTDMYANQFLP